MIESSFQALNPLLELGHLMTQGVQRGLDGRSGLLPVLCAIKGNGQLVLLGSGSNSMISPSDMPQG